MGERKRQGGKREKGLGLSKKRGRERIGGGGMGGGGGGRNCKEREQDLKSSGGRRRDIS